MSRHPLLRHTSSHSSTDKPAHLVSPADVISSQYSRLRDPGVNALGCSSGSISSAERFKKLMLRVQALGNLQITATALPDQAGFDELQGVSGNALIANNNAMSAFNFYSLKYIGAGITLFQNPSLTTFEAPRLLAIASNSGNDIATGLQVCAAPHPVAQQHSASPVIAQAVRCSPQSPAPWREIC